MGSSAPNRSRGVPSGAARRGKRVAFCFHHLLGGVDAAGPALLILFSLGQIQYQVHIFLQAKHQDQEIARSSWPITLFPRFLLLAIAETIFNRRMLDMAIVYHSCSSLAAFDMGAVLGHLPMQIWKLL